MSRSALRLRTVAGAAALTVGLTALMLGLGGRRSRATVEPTPRETASSGVQ